jgi:hypothetical protein
MASAESIRYFWTLRDTSEWFREMLQDSDVVKTTLDHIMATSCELQILLYDYTEPKNADCLQFCDACKRETDTTAWSIEKAEPRAKALANAHSEDQYEGALADLLKGWQFPLRRDPKRDTNLSSEACPNTLAGSTKAGCHECHRKIKPLWDRLHRAYSGLNVISSCQRGEKNQRLLEGEEGRITSSHSSSKASEQCDCDGPPSVIAFMVEVTLNLATLPDRVRMSSRICKPSQSLLWTS